jgi:aquaporin Z
MKKYIAEFIGTFTLVLVGCGAAVIAGKTIGITGIALAFGLALIASAYGASAVSGCHINPAVSLAFFSAGRLMIKDLIGYVTAQVLGGIAGAFVLLAIVQGQLAGFDIALQGLGQNGWGPGYLGEYSQTAAILFEFIATFLFTGLILKLTHDTSPNRLIAGVVIGLTLTAIHILGINITGVSVNPARSLGPAIFVGGEALSQLWLFLVVPSVAGIAAGFLSRLWVVDDQLLIEQTTDLNIYPQSREIIETTPISIT